LLSGDLTSEISEGHPHAGPTSGGDIPSIETVFDATTTAGLFDDTAFIGWGGFVATTFATSCEAQAWQLFTVSASTVT
jgi:hypothetical protein